MDGVEAWQAMTEGRIVKLRSSGDRFRLSGGKLEAWDCYNNWSDCCVWYCGEKLHHYDIVPEPAQRAMTKAVMGSHE